MSGCKECKYYLRADSNRICGLGMSVTSLFSTGCDQWESNQGLKPYVPVPFCEVSKLYKMGKRISQVPPWLKSFELFYYGRKCLWRNGDKKYLEDTLVVPKDTGYDVLDAYRDRYEKPALKFNETIYSMDNTRVLRKIRFSVSCRSEFLQSRKRRHRHTIH